MSENMDRRTLLKMVEKGTAVFALLSACAGMGSTAAFAAIPDDNSVTDVKVTGIKATKVSYQDPGANSVARTVQDKLADVQTDADFATFANAVTATANHELLVRPGVHVISQNITISSTLRFPDGAVLQPASGVLVTLSKVPIAGPYQIFDYSAGGAVRSGGAPRATASRRTMRFRSSKPQTHCRAILRQRPLRPTATITEPYGLRAPIHSTSLGKCLTAWIDEQKVEEYLKKQGMPAFTEHTIVTVEDYLKELGNVRNKGYAVDNEEASIGFRCISVPIRDYSGKVVAATSIAGTVRTVHEDRIDEIVDTLKVDADSISERLGYVPNVLR